MDILEKEVDLSSIYQVDSKKFEHFERGKPPYSRSRESRQMKYFCTDSKFGKYLAAFIGEELCFLNFYNSPDELKIIHDKLFREFNIIYHIGKEVEPEEFKVSEKLKLFLKCTDFEALVYKELLKLKRGETVCYEELACTIGKPKSVRPVANAVANNLIGYIIPCHRVIRKNGDLGNYRWGSIKKLAMLEYEGVDFEK